MPDPQLMTANQIEPALLGDFLGKVYSPLKSAFLNDHGTWWHRSTADRLVVQIEGQVVGYCAVIPVRAWIAGQVYPALWWVDLIIDPEYRGLGLQALFDRRVREMADLLLGFPNKLAAKIHRKHGWGVREDLQVLLLPLWLGQVKAVHNVKGARGKLIQGLARFFDPLAMVWRGRLLAQRSQRAWKMGALDTHVLSRVFNNARIKSLNTTWRDTPYFDWRYGAAPHPEEYSYYLVGTTAAPTHYLVARHITHSNGQRYSRILDVFGDFSDLVALQELLALAIQDAIFQGSGQLTLMSTCAELTTTAQRLGFLFSTSMGFCWRSNSPQLMAALAGENYWTLADSDNDAPE